VTLTDGQLDALRNLARKKAGAEVGWIVISDARDLTEIGLAARCQSGWEITEAGVSMLADAERRPPPTGDVLRPAFSGSGRPAEVREDQ
jgi:hypothetical protein